MLATRPAARSVCAFRWALGGCVARRGSFGVRGGRVSRGTALLRWLCRRTYAGASGSRAITRESSGGIRPPPRRETRTRPPPPWRALCPRRALPGRSSARSPPRRGAPPRRGGCPTSWRSRPPSPGPPLAVLFRPAGVVAPPRLPELVGPALVLLPPAFGFLPLASVALFVPAVRHDAPPLLYLPARAAIDGRRPPSGSHAARR